MFEKLFISSYVFVFFPLFYQKLKKMKNKVLFLLFGALFVAAVSMLISCDSKKEVKKVGPYELTEVNGKFGLNDSLGQIVLVPEFDNVEWNSDWGAVLADNESLITVVVNGSVVADALKVSGFEPIDGTDYVYILTDDGIRLWKKKTSFVLGPFMDICLIDDIVFMNTDGKWGAATINQKGLAPRMFDKIYVVKNDKTFAILVKNAKGWEMFNSGGVTDGLRYNTSSKVLEKQIKALNIAEDVAVVRVDWNL